MMSSSSPSSSTSSNTGGGENKDGEAKRTNAYEILDTEEREDQQQQQDPVWCPELQIYVGGVVPGTDDVEISKLLKDGNGCLRVFGYGSLCWNPGTVGKSALADSSVSTEFGRVRGYRRCWCQRSTDHRGTPSFPGVVCTLLTDDEYRSGRIRANDDDDKVDVKEESLTEGLLYEVPPDLVEECLAELDFREKGVRYTPEMIIIVLFCLTL